MIESFILHACAAGIGISMMAGPIGSMMVWRRMAFFGDALSHSALLGVALSLLINIHTGIGIVAATVFFSFMLALSQKQRSYSSDTILGILAHGTLAVGLVIISLAGIRVDLYSFLFGDILSVTQDELITIFAVATLYLLILKSLWKSLLLTTINSDLAQAEGVNTQRVHTYFIILVALLVALSVKIVGVLLVTSLLIIPAATARIFSSTPERMAFLASCIGITSVLIGVFASMHWDIPTGPAIVVAATLLFSVSTLLKKC